jgi:hypothetical protein
MLRHNNNSHLIDYLFIPYNTIQAAKIAFYKNRPTASPTCTLPDTQNLLHPAFL